jgi:hypothetical protein
VRLEVADTGIGDQARVFERFYRVDRARSRPEVARLSIGGDAGSGWRRYWMTLPRSANSALFSAMPLLA